MVVMGLSAHHVVLMPTVLFLFGGMSIVTFKSFLELVHQTAKGSFNHIGFIATVQPYIRSMDTALLEAFGKSSKIKVSLTAVVLTAILFTLMAIKVSLDQLRTDVRAAAKEAARASKDR